MVILILTALTAPLWAPYALALLGERLDPDSRYFDPGTTSENW